jgi:hypothetical protein
MRMRMLTTVVRILLLPRRGEPDLCTPQTPGTQLLDPRSRRSCCRRSRRPRRDFPTTVPVPIPFLALALALALFGRRRACHGCSGCGRGRGCHYRFGRRMGMGADMEVGTRIRIGIRIRIRIRMLWMRMKIRMVRMRMRLQVGMSLRSRAWMVRMRVRVAVGRKNAVRHNPLISRVSIFLKTIYLRPRREQQIKNRACDLDVLEFDRGLDFLTVN